MYGVRGTEYLYSVLGTPYSVLRRLIPRSSAALEAHVLLVVSLSSLTGQWLSGYARAASGGKYISEWLVGKYSILLGTTYEVHRRSAMSASGPFVGQAGRAKGSPSPAFGPSSTQATDSGEGKSLRQGGVRNTY